MLKNINKKLSRISPQVIVIAALAAVIGSSGLALFFTRSASEADAGAVPRVARIERVDGDVDIARSFAPTDDSALDSALEWDDATLNAPLSAGDRIYARENSRATLALTGRNFARIDPGTTLDVLSFTDDRTQLALRSGSAIFDVGHLEPGELFEVATPHGAVDFYEPGLYQVGFGDDGSAMISVLSGLAEVVGLAGSGQISKGEMLTLLGTVAAQAALSRLAPDLAGGIVDDYYGYRYPDYYDGRYRDYDVYLDDPYYYQPYRRARSYRAVRYEDAYYDVPGWYDLDDHGDWVDYEGYGRCWSPRVDAGWSPYRNGSWVHDDLWGPTWVSNEPWGWAPYHYGRWACMNNGRWVWVPENVATYAPALVAFVPLRQTNQVGWVPLAPGEPYIPRTYDAYYRPRYYGAPDVVSRVVSVQRTYVNLSVPSAVTAVPVSAFTRGGASEFVTFANPQVIAQSQPVLDPFAIDGVREVLVRKKNGRYKVKQVPVYAQEAFNRPVVTSAAPLSLPGRPDLVQAFNAQVVPEKKRKNKIKWNDGGQVVVARRPDGLPQPPIPQPNASAIAQERGQRIAALRVQAAQGNQEARRELRELKRQQREEEKMARRAARQQVTWPQALPPTVAADANLPREQRKAQKRLERQQQEAARQQQREQRRQMKRQAEAQQAAQLNQQRELQKAQRRAERQQRLNQQRLTEQQNQQKQRLLLQQAEKDRQQRKAARQAARQQQAALLEQQREQRRQMKRQGQAQQAAQMNQQRELQRAQRRAERQRLMEQQNQQRQQAAQQAEMMRQQRKAERRAARQQAAMSQQAPRHQMSAPMAQPGNAGRAVNPDRAWRKAERAQRRAERGKP